MHEFFPSLDIEVKWTTSEPQQVTEGDGVEVRLRAEAFGVYANPIQIGVICAPTQVTGVPAGRKTIPDSDTSRIDILLVYLNASWNILNCCLQPPSAATSSSHLEPGLSSQTLRLFEASHLKNLWYQSGMMTLLNRASPLSVLFKEVLWMLSVVLNQIESQSKFVMMMVSTCILTIM